MKITAGHAVSLGLNGLLFLVVVVQWREGMSDAGVLPDSISVRSHAPTIRPIDPRSTPPGKTPVEIGSGWQHWIEPLRDADTPTDVLATLVRSDFDHRWQKREAEMQRKYMQGQADADALAALALEHDSQLEADLISALGPEEFRRWDRSLIMQSLNVSQIQMSESECDLVYELERRLRADLRNAQADKLHGNIDQTTLNSREQTAQEEVAQKLRVLLGEQRAMQLQGADDTLGNLKRGLSSTSVSNAQLEMLSDVQHNWDQSRSKLLELQNNTGDPAYVEAVRQAEEKWRNDFQGIAGANGFEQFLKSQDSRYADLRRIAANWQVSHSDIEDIFAAIGNYDEIVQEYSLDSQARRADPAAAQATLQQFQQQTERSLQQRLGSERFALLKQNGIVP